MDYSGKTGLIVKLTSLGCRFIYSFKKKGGAIVSMPVFALLH